MKTSAGTCIFYLGLLISAPLASANIDAAVADQSDANLSRLASLLGQLQQRGASRGDLSDVLTSLNQSQQPQLIRRSLRSLLPAVDRATAIRAQAKIRAWRHRNKPATQRVRHSRPGSASSVLNFGSYSPTMYATESSSSTNPRQSATWWLQAWQDRAEQSADDLFDGFDAEQTGASLGMDFALNPQLTVGLSYSTYSGEVDSNIFGLDDQQGDQLSLSAIWSNGNHSLSAQVSRSEDEIDRQRLMLVLTETTLRTFRLRSDIKATQTSYGVEYSYSLLPDPTSTSNMLFTPFAGLSFDTIDTDDYVERGSDTLSLLVRTEQEEQFSGYLGASLGFAWFSDNWTFLPSISVAFEHDFKADPTVTTSRFRDTPLSFDTEGLEIEENRWRYTVGISLLHRNNVGVGLSYQGQRKGDYEYDGVVLNLQMGI